MSLRGLWWCRLRTTTLVITVLALARAAQAQAPVTPLPADQPFTRIISNLGRDIAALPSMTTAVLAGAGGGGALAAHEVDRDLSDWVARRPKASYTTLGRVGGDGWIQGGVALGTYVVGLAARHRATAHVGADLIRSHVLASLITQGLKAGLDRKRPTGSGHAFPSGHASATFTTAAVIDGHFGWKAGLPAYGFAGFVAWTRVRDNQHWLSDVVAGATIGAIVGRTVTAGHRNRPWTVSVAPAAEGLMVLVVRTGQHRLQTR